LTRWVTRLPGLPGPLEVPDNCRKGKRMALTDWEEVMRGTRYHEAGHAIAAYYHGYSITRVITTDDEWITYYRRTPGDGWADSWREACVIMAGQLADQRACWGEMRPEPWAKFLAEAETELELVGDGEDWLRGDYSDLLQLLRQMGNDPMGDGPEDSYRIVVEDSQQLVSGHWTEIEAVARALEQKSTLDGPEVVLIIERASRSDGQAQH
jgi:hypothetical protein